MVKKAFDTMNPKTSSLLKRPASMISFATRLPWDSAPRPQNSGTRRDTARRVANALEACPNYHLRSCINILLQTCSRFRIMRLWLMDDGFLLFEQDETLKLSSIEGLEIIVHHGSRTSHSMLIIISSSKSLPKKATPSKLHDVRLPLIPIKLPSLTS